jgi:hypothetical protein
MVSPLDVREGLAARAQRPGCVAKRTSSADAQSQCAASWSKGERETSKVRWPGEKSASSNTDELSWQLYQPKGDSGFEEELRSRDESARVAECATGTVRTRTRRWDKGRWACGGTAQCCLATAECPATGARRRDRKGTGCLDECCVYEQRSESSAVALGALDAAESRVVMGPDVVWHWTQNA